MCLLRNSFATGARAFFCVCCWAAFFSTLPRPCYNNFNQTNMSTFFLCGTQNMRLSDNNKPYKNNNEPTEKKNRRKKSTSGKYRTANIKICCCSMALFIYNIYTKKHMYNFSWGFVRSQLTTEIVLVIIFFPMLQQLYHNSLLFHLSHKSIHILLLFVEEY